MSFENELTGGSNICPAQTTVTLMTHYQVLVLVSPCNGQVDAKGGEIAMGALPQEWDSERFDIVDAGQEGLIALYSRSHRRLIRMHPDGYN